MNKKRQKEIIFFCPGQEYLFYTTGIYYIWELSVFYRIVVLLDVPFENKEILQRLKKDGIIYDFIPIYCLLKHSFPVLRAYRMHKHYFKKSRALFKKYQPAAILQHTDLEPVNIYFFQEAEYRKIPRILFKGGMVSLNINEDYILLRMLNLENFMNRWHIPYWAAYIWYVFIKAFGYYLNYRICPFLTAGYFFYPRINAFFLKGRWFNDKINYFDYGLTHSEEERKFLLSSGEPSIAVKFPLYDFGEQVFRYIYGDSIEENQEILILPTDIGPEYARQKRNMSKEEVIQYFYGKWSKVISILRHKFPTYNIFIKLSNLSLDNSEKKLYVKIMKLLVENDKEINLISPAADVSRMILRARVIVSSASTVLWWARHLKHNKVLISLDLFGTILHGNRFAHTKGIFYFNSEQSLAEFDFRGVPYDKSDIELLPSIARLMKKEIGV